MFPNKSTLPIAACLLFALVASIHALPSDAQLDSLVFAAINHDLAGQGLKRDDAEAKLEAAAQARIQADSAKGAAQKRLDQLNRSRASRQQELERELVRLRLAAQNGQANSILRDVFDLQKRFPAQKELIELARIANATRNQGGDLPATATKPDSTAAIPAATTPVCRSAPTIEWLDPIKSEVRTGSDSLLRMRIRINTPCGMSRLALSVNKKAFRLYPVGTSGSYELEDVLVVDSAGSLIEYEVCDLNSVCAQSSQVLARRALPLPPWIMWLAIAVLGAGIGLAIYLLLPKFRSPRSSTIRSEVRTPKPVSAIVEEPVFNLPIEPAEVIAPETMVAPKMDAPLAEAIPVAIDTPALAAAPALEAEDAESVNSKAATQAHDPESDTKTLPRASSLISKDLLETQAYSRQEIFGNETQPAIKLPPREILQAAVEKAQRLEEGESPRFLFRIPPGISSLTLDPSSMEAPLIEFLRFCMRRAKAKGLVLIALGQGPVNLEIVLEDSGPEPQPDTVRQLLDWKESVLNERMGLDEELHNAHNLLLRAAGSATVECRIDGGLRLRLRLPFYRSSTNASAPL